MRASIIRFNHTNIPLQFIAQFFICWQCVYIYRQPSHIHGSLCSLGQNLNGHSKESIDMTIVYVCYSSSTSPLVTFNKHRPSTSHQTVNILDCHNLPTLISMGVHGQVRPMELKDIHVQSCCRLYLDIKRCASSHKQNALFKVMVHFFSSCVEQDVLS